EFCLEHVIDDTRGRAETVVAVYEESRQTRRKLHVSGNFASDTVQPARGAWNTRHLIVRSKFTVIISAGLTKVDDSIDIKINRKVGIGLRRASCDRDTLRCWISLVYAQKAGELLHRTNVVVNPVIGIVLMHAPVKTGFAGVGCDFFGGCQQGVVWNQK